ncbi:2626_t:CDS:2, partial [Scutellospora calospora]
MFINTLVEGKILVKVLIDTTSKYNIISKQLFNKLESNHGLEAKISFEHSSKTHVCNAKIVIDGISILLFNEDFNKASSTKNNLSKSIESKPSLAQEESKKNNVKYFTDTSSNSDTSDSDSSNSSTSSLEIEVIYTYKTREVKKRPIRKRKYEMIRKIFIINQLIITYTMSNEPLSKGKLTKKYPKQAELLKALGINILKGHINSLANNEGIALAEVQDIDILEAVEDKGEETSNLTEAVSKLSVDDEGVKEIKNDNSRYNDQQARELVYGKVTTNLPGFTRDSLCKKTAKTRNIYKLFGESYDPDTKKIVKRIGIEKIERIRTY